MKRSAFNVLLAAFVFLAFFPVSPSNAITIGIDPASQTAAVGSTVDVDLYISGLGNGTAPSLGAFDIDVVFDPVILDFTSVVFGDQLSILFGSIQSTAPGIGTVNLFEVSFDTIDTLNSLQAPDFILATLTYEVLAPGTSLISVSPIVLSDAFGELLSAETASGQISTASVPEPATGLYIGLCLLAIVWKGRRQS